MTLWELLTDWFGPLAHCASRYRVAVDVPRPGGRYQRVEATVDASHATEAIQQAVESGWVWEARPVIPIPMGD